MIGFRFVRAAVGQFSAELGDAAHGGHRGLRIFFIHRRASRLLGSLHSGRDAHAFRAVVLRSVRDLMANHRGQAGLVLRNGKQAGINADFSTRQTKRIRLRAFEDHEFPFRIRHPAFGLFGDASTHFGDKRIGFGVPADRKILFHLLERGEAKLCFLVRRKQS